MSRTSIVGSFSTFEKLLLFAAALLALVLIAVLFLKEPSRRTGQFIPGSATKSPAEPSSTQAVGSEDASKANPHRDRAFPDISAPSGSGETGTFPITAAHISPLHEAPVTDRPAFSIGDRWTMVATIEGVKDPMEYSLEIADVSDTTVLVRYSAQGGGTLAWLNGRSAKFTSDWSLVETPLGNPAHHRTFAPALTKIQFPLRVGASWNQAVESTDSISNQKLRHQVSARVEAWEKIRTPNGEFEAYRIVLDTSFWEEGGGLSAGALLEVSWYSPRAKRVIRSDLLKIDHSSGRRARIVEEVASAQLK